MRVLVTGANGHIGCNLARDLLAQDREVVAFVRETSDLSGLEGLDVEYRYGDVRDGDSVMGAAEGCDVIVNLAAVYETRGKTADEIMKPAVEGVENALRAAAKHGVERVIHTSSTVAVGLCDSRDESRDESHFNERATIPYYRAKVESEKRAWALAEEMEVGLITLCPGGILGRHDYRITPSTRFVQGLANGSTVTATGGVTMTDVRDVSAAHAAAIDKGRVGERYLIAGQFAELKDWGVAVTAVTGKKLRHYGLPRGVLLGATRLQAGAERMLGKTVSVEYEEAFEVAGRFARYDNSKAERELGWSSRSIDEMVRETLLWLADRGQLSERATAAVRREIGEAGDWS